MKKVPHIPNDEYVLRRIYPYQHNDGQLDSTAFDDRYDRPSVHWEKIAIKSNFAGIKMDFDFFYRLKVSDIRKLGHNVIHEPDEVCGDDSHCVIVPEGNKWSRSKKRGLAGKGGNPIFGERVELPVISE